MPHISYCFPFYYCDGLREAPQLASVLREMKEGLDVVRSKVEALTAKVETLQLHHLKILSDSNLSVSV